MSDSCMRWVLRLAHCSRSSIIQHSCAYQPTGRRTLHPRVMLGLVVYGIINRQWSLRELEGLALRDVGGMVDMRGLPADHSTIGKFIQLHAEILSEEFFLELVKNLMTKLQIAPARWQATILSSKRASHYRLLRSEAMTEAARRAGRGGGQSR